MAMALAACAEKPQRIPEASMETTVGQVTVSLADPLHEAGVTVIDLDTDWRMGVMTAEVTLKGPYPGEIVATPMWWDADGRVIDEGFLFRRRVRLGVDPRTTLTWRGPTPQASRLRVTLSCENC
jgi:hypothetical protein